MKNYDDDEWYPESSRIEPQFERTGDISEFPRNEEEEARILIGKYEKAEVTAMVALPNDPLADWSATFADGHVVLFWIDDHHLLQENRVHIVERKGNTKQEKEV